MKKKTVHIISHSHWDREWYLPLERHKMKLLDLIDANMELFANDPEFKSFHPVSYTHLTLPTKA